MGLNFEKVMILVYRKQSLCDIVQEIKIYVFIDFWCWLVFRGWIRECQVIQDYVGIFLIY